MASGARSDTDIHAPLATEPLAEDAIEAFLAGLTAVDPTVLVRLAVRQGHLDDWLGDRDRPRQLHVLALGKAAPRMLWGLVECSVPFKGLGVAPRGIHAPMVDTFRWMPGDHPVPGSASFAAGRAVLAWADALPPDAHVLVLLSGGASAAAEAPAPGHTDDDLARLHRELVRSGLRISEMNARRAAASALKGGKLAARIHARTPHLRVWLLADTAPDEAPAVVGSGPCFAPGVEHRVLASNDQMVAAAALRLAAKGYSVFRHGKRIDGPAAAEVASFLNAFHGLPGPQVALVGGGEATVAVPEGAPPGGRCHHAALTAASNLAPGEAFVALASDGMDGATGAAGAWTVAADAGASAQDALARFDAATFLAARGRSVTTGATGTNANDLWIALRGAAPVT